MKALETNNLSFNTRANPASDANRSSSASASVERVLFEQGLPELTPHQCHDNGSSISNGIFGLYQVGRWMWAFRHDIGFGVVASASVVGGVDIVFPGVAYGAKLLNTLAPH
eukprot:6237782-Amphidinium_carterae.1